MSRKIPSHLADQGLTYDAKRDEYIGKNGLRIPRADIKAPSGQREELTEEMLNPQNIKEKISIWLEQDVLDEIRRRAEKTPHGKYARLINEALRQAFLPTKPEGRTIEALFMRLEALEAFVSDKKMLPKHRRGRGKAS